LCNPVMMMMMIIIIICPFPSNGAPVEWSWQGKTEVLGEKPVPVPLFPPQIPHGLTRDQTRASAVGGRRLTAWAMAQPRKELPSDSSLDVLYVSATGKVPRDTLYRHSPTCLLGVQKDHFTFTFTSVSPD
jgi:hypothetical protein